MYAKKRTEKIITEWIIYLVLLVVKRYFNATNLILEVTHTDDYFVGRDCVN